MANSDVVKTWIIQNKEWMRQRFDIHESIETPTALSKTKCDVADRIGKETGMDRESVELFFDEFDIHAILFLL